MQEGDSPRGAQKGGWGLRASFGHTAAARGGFEGGECGGTIRLTAVNWYKGARAGWYWKKGLVASRQQVGSAVEAIRWVGMLGGKREGGERQEGPLTRGAVAKRWF